jgi:outer membrane lipopolysaccharide assembly protein LptE/RlpB
MQKITILLTALILSLSITSCGFHTPHKSNSVNFDILGDENFTKIINKKLDKNLTKNFTLQINSVVKNKTNESFNVGSVSGYNLEVVVNFAVYKDGNVVLNNELSASHYLQNYNNSANSYQEQKAYDDMQDKIANQIIRKISRL